MKKIKIIDAIGLRWNIGEYKYAWAPFCNKFNLNTICLNKVYLFFNKERANFNYLTIYEHLFKLCDFCEIDLDKDVRCIEMLPNQKECLYYSFL